MLKAVAGYQQVRHFESYMGIEQEASRVSGLGLFVHLHGHPPIYLPIY